MPLTIAPAILAVAVAGSQAADLPSRAAAARAMSERRFDEAAAIYGDLLRGRPDDPELLTGLGAALVRGRRAAEALAPLERAVGLNPGLASAQALLGAGYLAVGQPGKAIQPLERVVAARPADLEHRRMLAHAYGAVDRPLDAVAELRRVTELAPRLPVGWYELGQAYNAVGQQAMATFGDDPEDWPWRQLLAADVLLGRGPLADAFVLYRESLDLLPSMLSIHDSIAGIYERTGHPDWAAIERAKGRLPAAECAARQAACAFRAGRHRAALDAARARSDRESRYWRVRAATELALAAFRQLEDLPDSPERRAVRATRARAEERYTDAIAELKAALALAPGVPALVFELASAYYSARDYEQALAIVSPLLEANPADLRMLRLAGQSLLNLRRPEEALPLLERAHDRDPGDQSVRIELGRAHLLTGSFAAAIPLIEPALPHDPDGSLHVQLARAYTAVGRREEAVALLARSQELQRADDERRAAAARRTIAAPK
jgi:predicted Zn-dependent protease